MQYVEVLISGVAQGAVYCVFAMGLSLVYGTARVLNFAHGSFFMVGAYIAWILSDGYLGLNYAATLAVLIPVLFLMGVLLERVVIRPLRWGKNWKMTTMMVTLGVAFMIDNLNLIVFGPEDKLLAPFFEGSFGNLRTRVFLSDLSRVLRGSDRRRLPGAVPPPDQDGERHARGIPGHGRRVDGRHQMSTRCSATPSGSRWSWRASPESCSRRSISFRRSAAGLPS